MTKNNSISLISRVCDLPSLDENKQSKLIEFSTLEKGET